MTNLFYRTFIEPRSTAEPERRHETMFNVVMTALLFAACLFGVSVLFALATGMRGGAQNVFIFLLLAGFFGSLLALSRKGHRELAAYLFLGLYFMAATYSVFIWGIDAPMALLSYGAIIILTGIFLGRQQACAAGMAASLTLVVVGFLQSHGTIRMDRSWRSGSAHLRDAIDDCFIFAVFIALSWLSNSELERSLSRAQESERALKEERDMLEAKVEERTKQVKAVEQEKVAQLYRFAEFGRLASGIFHDLLNPLTVVALSVEKLEDPESAEGREARAHIQRAISASKRMENLMQTAKKHLDSRERATEFSAAREISDAVDLLLHKSHRAGVDVRFRLTDDPILHGNPVKYFQIAVNLISNAIDSYSTVALSAAAMDGMSASIKPAEAGREPIVRISLAAEDDLAVLTIADNGCGISDDIRDAIYRPFFTTKNSLPRSETGFGLGLSVTKRIVEQEFGGIILFESTLGSGTTFTVRIPVYVKK